MQARLLLLGLVTVAACSDDGPPPPEFECNDRASADSTAVALVARSFTDVTITFDSLDAELGEYPYRTSRFWYSGQSGDTLRLAVTAKGFEVVQADSMLCFWAGGWGRLPPFPTGP